MSSRELVALLWGAEAGRVRQDARSRLAFTYDPAWRQRADGVPLSISLPLAAAEHGHRPVEAFLWGLLPDNEVVLDRWGRKFHVSPRNPFALLAHVGEDCAGAVQFAPPERAEVLRAPARLEVEWVTEAAVAARLRALREDQAAWRMARDTGQFSLAGSQPKTALLFLNGRWGVPSGRTPTTHILKPPMPGLDGHVENEHFCLLLAGELGLPVARSEVRRFGDEPAIVLARYDRAFSADVPGTSRKFARSEPVLRLHQEDLCQALGVRPTLKYQNEGGPSPAAIVEVLRNHSATPVEDVATFVDSLALNWLIAGTDAHAKNFSLLHGAGGRVRLAPLYDLASALPYPDLNPRRIQLAMKVGSEYRLSKIGRRHWLALAHELRLPPEATLDKVAALARALTAALPRIMKTLAAEGIRHPILPRLSARLAARCRESLSLLGV